MNANDPFDQVYTLVGLGLIVAGLIVALKIGAWVWFMTRVFHKPVESYPARVGTTTPDAIKKWLSVVATALGIISTTVGMTKGCGSASQPQPQPVQQIVPDQQQQLGAICCTYAGNCPLMMNGPIGSTCVCADMFGNVAQGSVCQ